MSNEPKISTARPLTAKGGIRAQTKSRKVGKNWWTKRWMSALEGFYIGAELPRGRAYAQAGQVLMIDIGQGKVKSKVQGHIKTPYDVEIKFKPTPVAKWKKLSKALGDEVYYTAKLLAGEMPESIEDLFQDHGVSLFPDNLQDLEISCSNKETDDPDRHVIAVFYLLAEEFDRDPFLFMKLRGLDREKLIKDIGASSKKRSAKTIEWVEAAKTVPTASKSKKLPTDTDAFWKGKPFTEELLGDVRIPPVPGALSKHLGHFPMWRGEERFLDALEMVYRRASQNGMDVFLGDW